MNLIYILLSLVSFEIFAAGSGGGHVSDLLYPAINVGILLALFFWKVYPMLIKSFNQQHKDVSEAFNLAEIKETEAQLELDSVQKKIAGSEEESSKVISNATKEAQLFEKKYVEEIDVRVKRSADDLEKRIAGERDDAIAGVTEELLEKVIADAKASVSGDGAKKKKVLEKFLTRL